MSLSNSPDELIRNNLPAAPTHNTPFSRNITEVLGGIRNSYSHFKIPLAFSAYIFPSPAPKKMFPNESTIGWPRIMPPASNAHFWAPFATQINWCDGPGGGPSGSGSPPPPPGSGSGSPPPPPGPGSGCGSGCGSGGACQVAPKNTDPLSFTAGAVITPSPGRANVHCAWPSALKAYSLASLPVTMIVSSGLIAGDVVTHPPVSLVHLITPSGPTA